MSIEFQEPFIFIEAISIDKCRCWSRFIASRRYSLNIDFGIALFIHLYCYTLVLPKSLCDGIYFSSLYVAIASTFVCGVVCMFTQFNSPLFS